MDTVTRRQFLAAAGVTALAGCSTGGTSDDSSGRDPGGATTSNPDRAEQEVSTDATTSDGGPEIPLRQDGELPLPMAGRQLREEARSGGPGKDGIPAIGNPSFVSPAEADFLDSDDIVLGVVRNGEVTAYPRKILVHHEIVNDTIGGEPVAVTYCPLTGTAQEFERGSTTFGVSGRLINNNLVMYDRASDTWWPQIPARAIPGPWNPSPIGGSLREFRVVWTTFERWRDRYPETAILSTETGFARNYERDPYAARDYYTSDETLFPRLNPDDRHPPKSVFVGARTPAGAVAFRKETLAEDGLMTGQLDSDPVLAAFDPALRTAYVYRNPDQREFVHTGERIDGPDGETYGASDLPLERILAFDAMWFAWSGFYPESAVYA